MKTIDERYSELFKELEYQKREEISAEELHRKSADHLRSIRQHINTIGTELQYLTELKGG